MQSELLFVGKDFQRKGGDTVLRAFARIRRQLSEVRLTILGPERPRHVPAGVDWWGLVTDREQVEAHFRSASVFLMPSFCEPFGLVFLEAMVHGLPCIGSRCDAMPEIIEDGVTGFLVEPGNAEALEACVLKLLRDPELARRMGCAGHARVMQRYTWDRVAARIDVVLVALRR